MKASKRFVDGAFANTTPVAQGLKKGTATPTIAEFLCGGAASDTTRAPSLAVKEPARRLAASTRERAARNLAGPFDGAARSGRGRAC